VVIARLFKKFSKKRLSKEALNCFVQGYSESGETESPQLFSSKQSELEYRKLVNLWEQLEDYPIEFSEGLESQSVETLQSRKTNQWLRPACGALAACLLAFVLVFTGLFNKADFDHYETRFGERIVVNLDDGSRVKINSASKVIVNYSDKLRQIEVKQGEAMFEVVKDISRKFIVTTKKGSVEAIGTEFNVNLHNQNMIVTVAEGKVFVSNAEDELSAKDREFAVEGQQVTVSAQGKIKTQKLGDLTSALAWVDGKIMLAGESLEVAVEEVNRYSKHKIDFLDSSLKTLPINGVFNAGDIEGFLSALEESYDISAVRSKSIGLTYLARRKKSDLDLEPTLD